MLLSLSSLLIGVLTTAGSLSSPAPTEGGGHGHVISNSTSKCYSGIHVRAAWYRCVADVRPRPVMLMLLAWVMHSAVEQTASQLGHGE